jgi:CheY-like chemotaxis protein
VLRCGNRDRHPLPRGPQIVYLVRVPAAERPILIVDDERDTREALRGMLEDQGYSVVEAANGRKALHYLTSDQLEPQLILVDLRMPEMTGWELVALVKAYAPLSGIPVVVISAHEPYRRIMPAGISAYLKKPIAPELLFKTVESCARTLASAKT